MKREVVQEFLGLPGIVGLALMDGRSRPCFYGVNDQLNVQQKEALAQGICQVIETTPSSFKTFEFQFLNNRAYIYKLVEGLVLLVLVDNAFPVQEYQKAVIEFKQTLEDNVGSAISTLRYLAGAQSQSNKMKTTIASMDPILPPPLNPRSGTVTGRGIATGTMSSGTVAGGRVTVSGITEGATLSENRGVLKDYLLAINELSQFAKKYLGTAVIVNYWKSSRPEVKWLDGFQIERSGQVSCLAENTKLMQQPVSTQQQQWLQEWVRSFMKRCSSVIRDFPRLAEAEAFSPEQKRLLFPNITIDPDL